MPAGTFGQRLREAPSSREIVEESIRLRKELPRPDSWWRAHEHIFPRWYDVANSFLGRKGSEVGW